MDKLICLKGRVSQNFFFLSWVLLGIIYDGKIVETARSNLKTLQKCKNSVFLGLEIWHSGFGAGRNQAFWLRGWSKYGILVSGLVEIWHSGFGACSKLGVLVSGLVRHF